jgi:F-type H+-transporting ATPase subunit epsilon
MAKTIKLQVVTPERQCLNEEVSSVILPGIMGEFGVLPGHANLLAALKVGVMKVEKDRTTRSYRLGGGYAEVGQEGVIVLAETLEALEGR